MNIPNVINEEAKQAIEAIRRVIGAPANVHQ